MARADEKRQESEMNRKMAGETKFRGWIGWRNLKDGLDFGVEGDVGDALAVDGESHAICFGEMEEAADVVVLVVAGK